MTDNLKSQKILLLHSNSGELMENWHLNRQNAANNLGYNLSTFNMSNLHDYVIFPQLDRLWKNKNFKLLKFYEIIGELISRCDILIHFGGALIHPEFIKQFSALKIYHCADDPDSSSVISRPVVHAYDLHAISNPAVLSEYSSWGCKNVFFWPLGSFHYLDNEFLSDFTYKSYLERTKNLSFVGSKYGVPRYRFLNKVPIIGRHNMFWRKKLFFSKLEKHFPDITAHGSYWKKGYIENNNISSLYLNSRIGINVHNSLGPINGRLYDLAAFGVLQVCDNKENLNHVFILNKEILGFDSINEAVDLINFYSNDTKAAYEIAINARERYLRDYTHEAIWLQFFNNLSNLI